MRTAGKATMSRFILPADLIALGAALIAALAVATNGWNAVNKRLSSSLNRPGAKRPASGASQSIRFSISSQGSDTVQEYRVVVLATPTFRQAAAGAAWGEQWAGFGVMKMGKFSHAVLGKLGKKKILDINPKGFAWSVAEGTDGRQQVGAGSAVGGHSGGALLWSDSARKVVMLNPAGYQFSQALSVSSGQESGYAETLAGKEHAALWEGTAASFVDLNPAGFISSDVFATDGVRQVGCGKLTNLRVHALVWSGTAASAIDINPKGYVWSKAKGISGGLITGYAEPNGKKRPHALLWHNSTGKFVDLNPKGYAASWAVATNGREIVGWGNRHHSKLPRALVWTGSPMGTLDLQNLLPKQFIYSQAFAITQSGTIYGLAAIPTRKRICAVAWVPKRIKYQKRAEIPDPKTQEEK